MAKKHSGGTPLGTGFKLNDPQPIVDYMVVEFFSDLATLPNQFPGMEVFVLEKDEAYIKKSTGWKLSSELKTNENKLVYISGLTLSSNVITLTAASIWKFGSTEYINASNLTLTIPADATGFKRVDRVLLGKTNASLTLLQGIPSTTRAYPKAYDTNEFIELTFVNVDGGAIAPIAPPILGDNFVSKAQQGFLGVGAGPIISISEKENYIITSGRTEIQHIGNYSTNSPLYDGREVYIYNQQSTAVTLYNKLDDGGNPLLLQMAFPSDQDYILQPKTGVKMKWSNLLNLWLFVASGTFDGLCKETLITTGGNKNNEPTPTKVLRFSNMVTPTILSGLSNPVDGKRVIIINKTLQNLNILHESSSSLEVNRLSNTNNQDLFIVVGGACEYLYIATLSRWILINIWATDYFASLVGIGKRAVAVTAQGMAVAEAIVDLKVWDTARTTTYTKSTINTAYSTLTKGQQVVCPNITGGGLTYEKYDDSTNDWIIIATPKLT